MSSHKVIEVRITRLLLERGGHGALVSVVQADLKNFMEGTKKDSDQKFQLARL
jgi:hypothetical protein